MMEIDDASDSMSGKFTPPDTLKTPAIITFKSAAYTAKRATNNRTSQRTLKGLISAENYHLYPPTVPTHQSIRASPSMYPSKRYCDITHLPAKYTDPNTRLRYANAYAFQRIRHLSADDIKATLALRNAHVTGPAELV